MQPTRHQILTGRAGAALLAAAALLLAPGAACAAAGGAAPAATKPPPKIVTSPRKEVAFSIAIGRPLTGPSPYAIAGVLCDGRAVRPPQNMKLDERTGAFTWTPTESQAGDYEIAFLVTGTPTGDVQLKRRITVQAGPVTTHGGEEGKCLRAWYAARTAAGNTGDFYDNRDGGHSRLNPRLFPQLDRIEYTPAMRQRRVHWGLQVFFLTNHVTFGNSSTASSDPAAGSNSRRAMLSARMVEVLYRQYARCHLYVYPEHRDHDAGHNGRGGYGDLFPANIPYLITSQGSSGSDRVFLEAVALTLAAFRPEVKRRLVRTGLLMPTVQQILRASSRSVQKPADYLTGKAHPTVFEGRNVDKLKMVKAAQAMRPDAIPPMAQLTVVEEDEGVEGRDWFDSGRSERLFDTPAAVARVVRSTRRDRRMVVSAAGSYDAHQRPLTYRWVVLRGDPKRIRIRPLDERGSRVELRVGWHERRPIRPGSSLASNRVDIGAFVHNGVHYSAPAFVCLFYLDDEARTYAPDGRVLEVGYGCGDSTLGYAASRVRPRDAQYDVTDWPALLTMLAGKKRSFAWRLLRKRLPPAAPEVFRRVLRQLETASAGSAEPKQAYDRAEAASKRARQAVQDATRKLDGARKAHAAKPTDATRAALKAAEAGLRAAKDAQKRADRERSAARRVWTDARNAAGRTLTEKRPRLKASVKDCLERALNAVKNDVELCLRSADEIDRLRAAAEPRRRKGFLDARDELVKLGILAADAKGAWRLCPAVAGSQPPAQRLTKYERSRLQWLNVAALRELILPGLLNRRRRANFVNPLLATPKDWRDVYHYDKDGRLIGWTRYDGKAREDYTADGARIVERDPLGRAVRARTVRYVIVRRGRKPVLLKRQPGDKVLHYRYASDDDRVGKVHETEKAGP